MRPFGTSQQLASRRLRAQKLLRHGQNTAQVATRVGATELSVRRWRQETQHPSRKAHRRRPGRPCRLTPVQLQRLLVALERGAFAYGYAEDYWTLDRITHLIWDLFRVRYRSQGVWYLLQRLGWSCQKPQRRPLHRDDEAVQHWKHYIWPQIKKVAAARGHPGFPR